MRIRTIWSFIVWMGIGVSLCSGQVNPKTAQDSTQKLRPVREITSEISGYDLPRMQRQSDSCYVVQHFQDSIRYGYFMAHVYRPAIQDPTLPSENRRFLDRLRAYLQCPTDSCGLAYKLLRPVYTYDHDSLHKRHGIVSNFPIDESAADYNGEGWADDLALSPSQHAATHRIVHANSQVIKRVHVQVAEPFHSPCIWYKSAVLRTVPLSDTLRPVFCSSFELSLQWTTDPKMNARIADWTACNNQFKWFCEWGGEMQTFARLQGVPKLWFATTIMDDRDERFPTRALFMDWEGKAAIALWLHQVEGSACSCL